MNYPFEFKEMRLTSRALDALGFTEYWAGSGDFGDRQLDLGGKQGDEFLKSKKQYPKYFIYVIDEQDQDEASGQGYGEPEYVPEHFCSLNFQKSLYFLHDMYEDIVANRTPEELVVFLELTKKRGVNMWPFLKSYIDFKSTLQFQKSNLDYHHTQSK